MKNSSQRTQQPVSPSMRFNLRMLLLMTLVCAVAAATWGGLTRTGSDRMLFLFFAAAAPFGVLALVGWLRYLTRSGRR